ncbi:MAG: LytTR family DNA-binding domain-containing protein [Tannerellaceae bacterium]|jgi:DNA-binding LytR/AlgR family response regulator|nr:LytTR family DNA-binding domain-containing protein [Tannerellaceae bacterium]
MKILIVEDETVAYENLTSILSEIDLSIEVIGNTESINQTIHWLQIHPAPDLILMDIHLSDGSAFSIFNSIQIDIPIIFTTAYDEYAIEAFKVNSIDYLLKPIKADELSRALHKFLNRTTQLSFPTPRFKDRLLIPQKDKLIPIDLQEISCFYTTDKTTRIYMKNGNSYPYTKTLEQISASLNPSNFFRANKQFIIARSSVKNITIWFDNRLLITLDADTPERIYISKNKASEFKAWVVNG